MATDDGVYKAYSGTLTLTPTGVILKKGMMGGGFLKGAKTIPYSSITAVDFKKAGMTAGYLRLIIMGSQDNKGTVFKTANDENTITFQIGSNSKFEEAKHLIEERMGQPTQPQQSSNSLNDLEKLAELKEKGIISQEEFDAKKKQLLGI